MSGAIAYRPTLFRTSFDRRFPAELRIASGQRVHLHLTDDAYAALNGEELDSGRVEVASLNRIAGPIAIAEARPGDALAVHIESIAPGPTGHVVYVARWRSRLFGVAASRVERVAIERGHAELSDGRRLPLSPMVGCVGVAPAAGAVSSLSPAAATGGNLDLVELRAGSVVYLPVQVPEALFSAGDLHAAMGRGEVVGAGIECGGELTLRFEVLAGRAPTGTRVLTPERCCFVGSHPTSTDDAERLAVRAAWEWILGTPDFPQASALAFCAAALHLEYGGPAGANVVAAFDRDALSQFRIQDHCPLPRLVVG
jgi:amidase